MERIKEWTLASWIDAYKEEKVCRKQVAKSKELLKKTFIILKLSADHSKRQVKKKLIKFLSKCLIHTNLTILRAQNASYDLVLAVRSSEPKHHK